MGSITGVVPTMLQAAAYGAGRLNSIKELHIKLNVTYYIHFIRVDINRIKFTFRIYVIM
jgi:hypothetical protein